MYLPENGRVYLIAVDEAPESSTVEQVGVRGRAGEANFEIGGDVSSASGRVVRVETGTMLSVRSARALPFPASTGCCSTSVLSSR